MNNVLSQRSIAIATPVLSIVVGGSLFVPWMRFGVGSLRVSFTPITSDVAAVGAWILIATLFLATSLSYLKEWALALVGWSAASIAGFAVLNWLVIQRFSSLLSIRIVKTEFGSVIQPALVIAMVSSLLLVAVVVFDSLGEISTSPLLQTGGAARVPLALVGSIAILLARDLPFVYARFGSVTWAVGGGSIPAVGELLGVTGLVCATCLIIGLFVSHVSLERAVFYSAAAFGVIALLAALLDAALVTVIASMLGRLSGRPDGKPVIESAFGPWACVAVSALILVGSLFAGRIGRAGLQSTNVPSTDSVGSLPQI
jgi:hypothetical protein